MPVIARSSSEPKKYVKSPQRLLLEGKYNNEEERDIPRYPARKERLSLPTRFHLAFWGSHVADVANVRRTQQENNRT